MELAKNGKKRKIFHEMLQKILSYLFPIPLKKYTSKLHGILTMKLVSGKMMLNTEKTNYSYGSLQTILKKGLTEIGLDARVKSILVLGLGGGSIIETVREDFQSSARITLIDIDPLMIFIAKEVFHVERFSGVEMIVSDALEYLQNSDDRFDIIIVDIFIVDIIPTIFTEPVFIGELRGHLSPHGKILYNTMRSTMPRELFEKIQQHFSEVGLRVRIMEKIAGSNDLILAEKV